MMTYMTTATAISPAQISGSHRASPSRPSAYPNIVRSPVASLGGLALAFAAGEPLLGGGEGALGPLGGRLPGQDLMLVRSAPQELDEVVRPRGEDDRVDDHEG